MALKAEKMMMINSNGKFIAKNACPRFPFGQLYMSI